jgi:23S rRNA A2030 N6-methylase RlmJ
MNYRHAFHAGNFADVLKHLVLAQCLEHLGDKPKPYRVIDTHAGVGAYDLTGDEAQRSPEWLQGIDRLMKADIPAESARIARPVSECGARDESRRGADRLSRIARDRRTNGAVR